MRWWRPSHFVEFELGSVVYGPELTITISVMEDLNASANRCQIPILRRGTHL